MPTVLKLALDAQEYERDLARVIAMTRAAAQKISAEQAQVRVDVSKAVSDLSDLSGKSDMEFQITGKVEAPEIPAAEDQSYTVTGTVNAPEVPKAEDQSYTITGTVDAPE